MRLSVATIISQAVALRYPITAVLDSVVPIADQIVVNVDATRRDGTWDQLWQWWARRAKNHIVGPTFAPFNSPWDWGATDQGRELARQTDIAFESCTGDWVLYVQADEIVHEEDHDLIRHLLTLPEDYAGAEFLRLYFFGSPSVLRTDWTLPLVRLFRRGWGRSTGDAMNCKVDGLVWPHDEGLPRLFHYSRVSDAETIGRRIRNLDTLFHPEADLAPVHPYDFVLRRFDTHAVTESPEPIPPNVLVPYEGTHPEPARRWFGWA